MTWFQYNCYFVQDTDVTYCCFKSLYALLKDLFFYFILFYFFLICVSTQDFLCPNWKYAYKQAYISYLYFTIWVSLSFLKWIHVVLPDIGYNIRILCLVWVPILTCTCSLTLECICRKSEAYLQSCCRQNLTIKKQLLCIKLDIQVLHHCHDTVTGNSHK